jgi:hypothetical protein
VFFLTLGCCRSQTCVGHAREKINLRSSDDTSHLHLESEYLRTLASDKVELSRVLLILTIRRIPNDKAVAANGNEANFRPKKPICTYGPWCVGPLPVRLHSSQNISAGAGIRMLLKMRSTATTPRRCLSNWRQELLLKGGIKLSEYTMDGNRRGAFDVSNAEIKHRLKT